MKKIILSLVLASSSFAYAGRAASPAEIRLLCKAVDMLLVNESADAALDLIQCVTANGRSELISEGAVKVSVPVELNTPSYSLKQTCELTYLGSPKTGNIIGGLEAGVSCR